MIVINFYFSEAEKWIEYSLNGEVIKQYFFSAQELRTFISNNGLMLTYEGCTNC